MYRIVVHGTDDAFSGFQRAKIVDKKLCVKCVGVVLIELTPLLIRHIMVRFIVVIMIDDRYVVGKTLDKLSRDRGLTAAGAAGNTDYHYVAHTFNLFCCFSTL